ncbi:CRISPR-associated helicase Cas3' [Kineothrix sp. MB12-C1]|uniref:CRISPR-associated helicase Cas3' n=1 Tax=Kineothrix sp. MB12-C1 TaxID=3070215 RepID=UPI0027D273D7|nr:CRISPR-associated helicase Cas3' [Kineothrix sp. MB12-C1]WMC93085.1 CRISPR-associated helicase Cas3' [Kineothrix sp. MB12-C1]
MRIKTNLWGKKKEKDGQYYWLPLEQHLLDTSNVLIQIWNHWLSEGQREFILESISDSEENAGVNLVSFIGLTHDLAKSTPCFALRPSGNNQSADLDKILTENLIRSGFTGLENWSTELSSKSPHALASQVLLDSYGVGEDIASIIGGHHGRTVNDKWEIGVQLEAYTANYYQYDHGGECTENWKKMQRKLFEWALEESGYKNVDALPKIEQPAQVLLQGLLIMADWIASNEEYFPLFPIDKEEEEFQEERLEYGWERWTKTYPWIAECDGSVEEQYSKRFQFHPREIQRAFSESIDKAQTPGIIILEAPMGIGKTEAALLGVEQLAEKGKCSGMFFGLPTQATSDSIFQRIEEWIEKIANETGDNKSIQLVHGKAQFNETFQNLKNAENIYADEGSVVINEWFTGRKTAILDDFVVGTVDQFLLAGLKQKHLALRHLGLSKKVIVIDEIHAYDAYMGEFLYRVVEWLGAYRVPIIILSATLPASRRTRLVETYCRGMGMKKRNIKAEYSDWKETEAYPLITYTDGDRVSQLRDFPLGDTKEVKVELMEEDDLVTILQRTLSNGGIVGIIVNTVKRAQEFAEKLEHIFGRENISVLHSGFLAPHRREKEKQLLNEIGKNAKRPKLRIVIGTQVLEQSIDIDFDAIFTDIAPIDLLLQRIGRLHRHAETIRPENLKAPVVYVMGIQGMAEFEEGTRTIYGDYLLTRTQLVLPEKLVLPEDISRLVQKVYKENPKEELDIPVSIREKYKEMKEKDGSERKKKEKNADVFRLAEPYYPERGSLIGWLKDDIQSDTEEAGLAKVRDGSDSMEVILIKRKEDELYLLDDITNIGGELTPALAKKISQQTIRLPHIFCYKTDDIIKELETRNHAELSYWQDEPWLKGSLGIILDEDNSAELIGYKLHYDKQYGLMVGKEEE